MYGQSNLFWHHSMTRFEGTALHTWIAYTSLSPSLTSPRRTTTSKMIYGQPLTRTGPTRGLKITIALHHPFPITALPATEPV